MFSLGEEKNIHALMRNKFNIGRGFQNSVISICFKKENYQKQKAVVS